MSEKDQKAYYAVIPANVRYDKRLKANEKLLYGEITALTNERGYCWAGNKYFSDLYGVTPQAVSKWINGLKDCGYISIEYTYKNGTKEIESRIIKLVSTNVSEVSTNVSGGINKCFRGYKQKVKDNNTCLNNTVNNTNEHINTKVSKKEENNNTQNRQVEISEELKQMQKEIEQLKAENEKLKTKKKKPKKQTKSYDEQIAEYTENEELQNALKAFVQMRSFIKKPMTEYALKLMLKKLDELGNNDTTKIAILNQSITHNWQGIFPLKNEYTNQEKQPEKKYDQNGYESEEELMKMLYGK